MLCYYARCILIRNTEQEKRDINVLNNLGLEISDPFTPENDATYQIEGMAMFERMVKSCQVLAFKALPDGSIPAGVAKEIAWAQEANIAVIELPTGILNRTLSVEETREYLRDAGQR